MRKGHQMLVAQRVVKGLALGPVAFPIALLLGLLSRAVGEPGYGSVAALLLVAGIASGAGEAMSESTSDRRPVARLFCLGLALTALMLYVAGGGIPPVSGLVLLGASIAARGLGRAEELLAIPVTIRASIDGLARRAERDAAQAA